jgi:hypothetical protein
LNWNKTTTTEQTLRNNARAGCLATAVLGIFGMEIDGLELASIGWRAALGLLGKAGMG